MHRGLFVNKIYPVLLILSLVCLFVINPDVSRAETDKIFELQTGKSSDLLKRPADAEYFWWDCDPKVNVELTFENGTKKVVSSEATFSEKIIAVKFINKTPVTQKIVLKTGF